MTTNIKSSKFNHYLLISLKLVLVTTVATTLVLSLLALLDVSISPFFGTTSACVSGTLLGIALIAIACKRKFCFSSPKPQEAILYLSISGNPTHLGHLSAVSTAIKELKQRGEKIREVFVSISQQDYIAGKVKTDNAKIARHNTDNPQSLKPPKVCLSQKLREQILNGVIEEAQKANMFDGVKVSYWDDQNQGMSDHPQSYARLQSRHTDAKVYLIAGSDLCQRMGNWHGNGISHAIIVSRGTGDPNCEIVQDARGNIIALKDRQKNRIFVKATSRPQFTRILLQNESLDFEDFSSSDIQSGKRTLPTPELQDLFQSALKADALYQKYLEQSRAA